MADGFSEYTKILASIPVRWRHIIKTDKQASDRNFNSFRRKCLVYSNVRLIKKDLSVHSVTVKIIYSDLVTLEQLPSRAIEFWNNTLPQTDLSVNWGDTWLFKLKQVKDNSLIQFNFKFMYNILPTPVNLFKWKLKDNDLCEHCPETGHIIHVFFYCKAVKLFRKSVEEIIRNTLFRNYEFKPLHVVYYCRDTIQETNSIDLFMNYALFSIYNASFTQNKITKNIVIKHLSHLLRSRLDIEKNRICKRDITIKSGKIMSKSRGNVYCVILIVVMIEFYFSSSQFWCYTWLYLIEIKKTRNGIKKQKLAGNRLLQVPSRMLKSSHRG